MKIKKIACILTLMVAFSWFSYTQENYYEFEIGDSYRDIIVNCITRDQNGLLWVGTTNGLILYDGYRTTFFQHDPADENSISNNHITALITDAHNNTWIGTRNGFNKYDPCTQTFERFRFVSKNRDVYERVEDVVNDGDSVLWLAISNVGLARYSLKNQHKTIYKPNKVNTKETYPMSLLLDDREFWMGTDKNIQHFSIDKETFTNIDFVTHCELKNIRKIIKKQNGDMWFSAWEGGIGYISNDTIPVANCYNVFPQNQNCFTIFSCSKTEILAGTFNNGLQLLNIQNNTLQQVKHKNINHTLSFRSISSDRFQNTWFGTSKGIIRKGQFPYQFPDNCYAPGEQMADKYRSRDREKLPPELVKRFFGDNPEDLSCFANYKDSVYWIGTWTNGLIKYHKKTNQTKRYVPGQNTNLSLGFINDIFIDHEQSVWIATHGGLNEYDPITDDFIQYHVSPGTKTENILKILPGKQEDYLWLSSGKGIIRFNKKDKEFLVFDHHHNIPKLEFVPGSGEVEKDNKLVFGAERGAFSFYPDSIKYDSLPPLLAVRKIFVNGEPVAYKNNRVLQLSKNENNIKIWMQTSNLTLPERVRYRYKMSRVCDTWQDNGYNYEVTFTNLEPGAYTFQFNACNPDLVWAKSPLKLDIVIKDNRQRTIFILLIILFLSAAAVAVIIIRKKKIAVKKIKYSGTKISEDILQEYFQQLECYMQNQKPFKQKALHLDDVAKKLNIHPNYLSQAVNQLSGNNFFDYVNRYRVEESKKLLKDPAFENHNLMGIGFEAGFNSKSSFYAVFKKYTGMTPAQYRKKHLKK